MTDEDSTGATSRRRGLPRQPGGAGVPPQPDVPEQAVSDPVQPTAPRVRSGLPRPNASRDGAAPPTTAPRVRSGLPRPAASEPDTAAVGPVRIPPAGRPVGSVPRTTDQAAGGPENAAARTTAPAPRRRFLRRALVAVVVLVVLAVVVLAVRLLLAVPPLRDFFATYPGITPLPHWAPTGLPAWLEWQHFLNSLFLVLIIRTGWQVRTEKRPTAFWTSRRAAARPRRISLTLWMHQTLDLLWVVNGAVFYVLLFSTGQWTRIVPTSWAVVPNALTAALRYISLDWPTEDGWVNYNSLQLLSYFFVVFVLAPLAILSGVRMSALWPARATRLGRAYPVELARSVHFPVMVAFVAFVVVHVTLVLATGALRNLNHMYAGQDEVSWTGVVVFGASLLVIVALWVALRPIVVAPIARLFGAVGR